MSDQTHGYRFEKKVHELLKDTQRRKPLIVHRFSDTRAARVNFLPNQPGDFMTVFEGRAVLLETKASTRFESLRSCFANMFSGGQAGHHKLWQRAGARTFLLFHSVLTDAYEVWEGGLVLEHRALSRPLPKTGAMTFTDDSQFKKALVALVTE